MQQLQQTESVVEKPRAGQCFKHFRQSQPYRCLGIANHGQIEVQFCATGIYEPTMERFRVVEMPDGSLIYQFPDYPDKDLGEIVLYRETPEGMPWGRCLPNFVEIISYGGELVQRFTLVL